MNGRESAIYDEVDKDGYLLEKKLMRNNKTWCSLQGATLYLQKAQQTQGAVQTVDMATEVQLVRQTGGPFQFEIVLKKGKNMTLICASSAECSDWVRALVRAMALKSNGVGQSQFYSEEDAYALLTDDGTKANLGSGSEYEDVQCLVCKPSPPPPLPSMNNRNIAQQLSKEAESEYLNSSSDVIQNGIKENEEAEYSECSQVRVAPSTYTNDSESSRNQVVDSSPGVEMNDDVYAEANTAEVSVENLSHNEEPADASVTLRASTYTNIPVFNVTEPEDDYDGEDSEEINNVFAEMDEALSYQDTTGLTLNHPLVDEDFLPIQKLTVFLDNNEYFDSSLHHSSLLATCEKNDPISDLKLYLQQIELK